MPKKKNKILRDIDLQTYLSIKNLFKACSCDLTIRVILSKVFYHAKRKRLVATDGHILRLLPINLGNKDFLISEYDFPLSQAAFKKKYGKDGKADIFVDISADEEFLPYPEYEKVIPGGEHSRDPESVIEVGIALDLCSRFLESMEHGLRHHNVKFIYHSPLSAIKVIGISGIDGEDGQLLGVIMPCRCLDTPLNDKLAKDREELKHLRQYKLEAESKKNVEEIKQEA